MVKTTYTTPYLVKPGKYASPRDVHNRLNSDNRHERNVCYLPSEQFELDEVNTNHQREMQDILSDAASKIKRFKEQLASKQGQLNTEAHVSMAANTFAQAYTGSDTRRGLAGWAYVALVFFANPRLPALLDGAVLVLGGVRVASISCSQNIR